MSKAEIAKHRQMFRKLVEYKLNEAWKGCLRRSTDDTVYERLDRWYSNLKA